LNRTGNNNDKDKNILHEYIFGVVDTHMKKTDIRQSVKIEYSLLEYSEDLYLDIYQENAPLLSIISFIKVDNHCMLFTNVNSENYKYKEIYSDDNMYAILIPNNKTHIVFDATKLYGFFDIQKKYMKEKVDGSDDSENFFYLKINVLEDTTTSPGEPVIEPLSAMTINYDDTNLMKYSYYVTNCEIHDVILYNTNDEDSLSGIHTILKKTNPEFIKNKMICLNFYSNTNTNFNFLLTQYGDVINDFLEISNNRTITEKNRFYEKKILPGIISIDVCHWIINESERNDNWVDSSYQNYEYHIKAENIPHVFNFLIFVSNYWLTYFKEIYNIPEKMKINIEDMFVAKNTNNSYKKKAESIENKKNNYFICNIQINDAANFQGGEIYFDNSEEKLKLNQGDMLIFNSSKTHNYNELETGTSYNLVLIIEFVLQG
jgi:hypothetical protein